MSCRDEILKVIELEGMKEFTPLEMFAAMQRHCPKYPEQTVRYYVCTRMCINAPGYHAGFYKDLVRVDRGRYRLHDPKRE